MSATSQVIGLATTFMGAGGSAIMALWNVEDGKKKATAFFAGMALSSTAAGCFQAHNLIEQIEPKALTCDDVPGQCSAPIWLEAPKAP